MGKRILVDWTAMQATYRGEARIAKPAVFTAQSSYIISRVRAMARKSVTKPTQRNMALARADTRYSLDSYSVSCTVRHNSYFILNMKHFSSLVFVISVV
jgi:hypothetical protein